MTEKQQDVVTQEQLDAAFKVLKTAWEENLQESGLPLPMFIATNPEGIVAVLMFHWAHGRKLADKYNLNWPELAPGLVAEVHDDLGPEEGDTIH